MRDPSTPRSCARSSGSPSVASTTTAPAPSPNSTAVLRSFWSVICESVSDADDEGTLVSGAEQRVGGHERVDEARAGGVQVERRPRAAELVVDPGGGRGHRLVWRRGREDEQVDVGRRRARPWRGPLGRLDGEAARRAAVAPLLDSGPLDDPRVGGVEACLEVAVRDDLVRQAAPIR